MWGIYFQHSKFYNAFEDDFHTVSWKSENTVRSFKFYFNFLTTEILRFLRYIFLS